MKRLKSVGLWARSFVTRDLEAEIRCLRVELHLTKQALAYVAEATGKLHGENCKRLMVDPHAELEETTF